jgi:hypothetical protein
MSESNPTKPIGLTEPKGIKPEYEAFKKNRDFCVNEAPDLIRSKGFEGIEAVQKRLGIEDSHSHTPLYTTEAVLKQILDVSVNFDQAALPLLRATAEFIATVRKHDYKDWSHSVCHPIETYQPDAQRRERYSRPSLLDSEATREVLTGLVDESVRRKKEVPQERDSTARIIGPIASYNIVTVEATALDHSWPYRPASLDDAEYKKIMLANLEDQYGFNTKSFLIADSPLAFYREFLEKKHKLPEFIKPGSDILLFESLEKLIPKADIDAYIAAVYAPNNQPISYDELKSRFSENQQSQELVSGVFVDVEGTLIMYDSREKKDVLSARLVQELEEIASSGRTVTIFTGGNITAMEEKLKAHGFPEKFLPVRSKGDFRGKLLETLVDDTPPEYQGFGAKKVVSPFQSLLKE